MSKTLCIDNYCPSCRSNDVRKSSYDKTTLICRDCDFEWQSKKLFNKEKLKDIKTKRKFKDSDY